MLRGMLLPPSLPTFSYRRGLTHVFRSLLPCALGRFRNPTDVLRTTTSTFALPMNHLRYWIPDLSWSPRSLKQQVGWSSSFGTTRMRERGRKMERQRESRARLAKSSTARQGRKGKICGERKREQNVCRVRGRGGGAVAGKELGRKRGRRRKGEKRGEGKGKRRASKSSSVAAWAKGEKGEV